MSLRTGRHHQKRTGRRSLPAVRFALGTLTSVLVVAIERLSTAPATDPGRRSTVRRARSVVALAVSLALVGASMAIPTVLQASPARAATTAQSTVSKTGTDVTNGSSANSSGTVGSAAPGDTINWVVNYTNNNTSNANVTIHDPITAGQSYVGGSLTVPPGMAKLRSTNTGSTWLTGTPVTGDTGVGATGTVSPGGKATSATFVANGNPVVFNTPGGDGWSVEGLGGNVYTVFHHNQSATTVFCATITNQVCPGWPGFSSYVSDVSSTPIGTGPVGGYTTSGANGSFIANGNLYWPVQATTAGSAPVGIQCLNLTTELSCGFTQLDVVAAEAGSGSGGYANIAGDGIPASNGNYYFTDIANNLLCFNPSSGPCGVTPIFGSSPLPSYAWSFQTMTVGRYIFATSEVTDNILTCFDTATNSLCPGYPVDAGAGGLNATTNVSSIAPILSPTGAILGACVVTNQVCFSLSGAAISYPYSSSAIFGNGSWSQGTVVGSKYYYDDASTSTVVCVDFAVWSGSGQVPNCTGYTPPSENSGYTVRALANLPGCMAADGDTGQIVIFDAQTGKACLTTGGTATQTLQVGAPFYCDGATHSGSWTTLQLNGLSGSEYGSAQVTISGSSGPIPGFTNITLAPGQTSLNISSIPMSGPTAGLTATVTFTGVTNVAAVKAATFSLNRTGDTYSQICYQTTVNPVACGTTATISDNATAITSLGAVSDGPTGNSSGPVNFRVTPTALQCPAPSLSIVKSADKTSVSAVGQVITYAFRVTNTGNVTLTNVTVTDTQISPALALTSGPTCPSSTLAPGASETCTATYTVTQADLSQNQITNAAVVTGTPPSGPPVISPPSHVAVGVSPPHHTLAATGVPVLQLLWLSIGLSVIGSLMVFLATRRPERRRKS